MFYRRIDITLPPDDETDLVAWIEKDITVIDAVTTSALDSRRAVSVLLPADSVEVVLDRLQERYRGRDRFRAVVLETTALLPDPEAECGDDLKGEGGAAEQRKARSAGRIARNELLEDLKPGTTVDEIYLLTVFLSSVIAAIGLVRDAPAVVIGAMVIAPLLLPNMSLALATTLGDVSMAWRAGVANLAGLALSLCFAVAMGFWVPFDPSVDEITSRSIVGYADVALAVAAGVSGAIAVTSGVSANLIGVMVAVALLPPLVALGLLVGAAEWSAARGAALLVGINIASVNLAAVGTFWLRGVRPSRWYEDDRAKRATLIALSMWTALLGVVLILIWLADVDG